MTDRPSEFFDKYYDNDGPIFHSHFGNSDRTSRYTYKSPARNDRRSQSPFGDRMTSIIEENEQDEIMSNRIGGKARSSNMPILVRYSSQTRLSEQPEKRLGGLTRTDHSQKSLSRLTDSFYGFNR